MPHRARGRVPFRKRWCYVAALVVALLLSGAWEAAAPPGPGTSGPNLCSPPTPYGRCDYWGHCYCSAYDLYGNYRPCSSPAPYLRCTSFRGCWCSAINPELLGERRLMRKP
jgi:hypothetical protein